MIAEVQKSHGQDLDFLAEMSVPAILFAHNCPFTVVVEPDELLLYINKKRLEVGTNRYIVASELGEMWMHAYQGDTEKVLTKFVYDREKQEVIAAQIIGGYTKNGDYWVDLSAEGVADLEDSLKNANDDALENPLSWGLAVSNELPHWVEISTLNLKM